MIVVVDTNVVGSGLMSPGGTPDRVLRAGLAGAFGLVTSAPLLTELAVVLSRPRIRKRTKFTSLQEEAFVESLASLATIVVPTERLAVTVDPDDNRVLEAAVAADADFIVSGDADLLELGSFRGIQIVTPAAFVVALGEAEAT